MMFFLAAGLPGSIICFLLLFLLKLAIKSLVMWKEGHDTGTVTWAGSLEHIHLSVHAHQHFSRTESLIYIISTPSSLKALLSSLINFRSVLPAGLISHQYAEIHPLAHQTPCRAIGAVPAAHPNQESRAASPPTCLQRFLHCLQTCWICPTVPALLFMFCAWQIALICALICSQQNHLLAFATSKQGGEGGRSHLVN